MPRGGAAALLVAFGAAGCGQPAESPVAASATSPSPSARKAASRPPRQLCATELAHLEQQATFVDGLTLPAPPSAHGAPAPPLAPSAIDVARAAPPREPTRKVLLETSLADDWIVEAIVLPNFAKKERIVRPKNGEIARLDVRGARGDVVALVRRKLTGGLYDYVGACQIARTYLEVLPPRAVAPTSPSERARGRAPEPVSPPPEITLRVTESSGHVYVDVVGGDVTPSYVEW